MSAQGRRSGSRRRRSSDTQATAPIEAIAPAAALTSDPDVELLDDTTVAIAGGRRGGSLGRSLPGAIVGTLLVVGLAFGAAGPGGALGPKSDAGSKNDAAQNDTAAALNGAGNGGSYSDGYPDGADGSKDDGYDHEDDPDATDKPDGGEGDEPDATDKPDSEETDKPAPERTPKPEPKPDPTKEPTEHIAIGLAIKDNHPFIEWGSCEGLDFDYYKVVRSEDSTVSWPTGGNDEMIAAVERGGPRKAWDKYAPHGHKVWYRVFCVRKTEAGYKVVNSSAAKGIEVPEEVEPPDPITLDLEAFVNEEGKVFLSWSACDCEDFGFYKIVKSTSNDNPSYLPWTDGTEVIGVVEDMYATEFHDWAPDSGETAWYRVQCIGWVGDHKVLLGQSAVVSVTTP